jgi:hypothetical protein
MVGAEHHEPLEVDTPRDRLDRVERPGRVEIGDHRPAGLCLGAEPQGEGRLAARDVALQRRRGRARQAAGPQDRIESGEARRHHRIEWRRRNVARLVGQTRPAPAQRPVSPLLGEVRKSVGQCAFEGECGKSHGPASIEQMFDTVKTHP